MLTAAMAQVQIKIDREVRRQRAASSGALGWELVLVVLTRVWTPV